MKLINKSIWIHINQNYSNDFQMKRTLAKTNLKTLICLQERSTVYRHWYRYRTSSWSSIRNLRLKLGRQAPAIRLHPSIILLNMCSNLLILLLSFLFSLLLCFFWGTRNWKRKETFILANFNPIALRKAKIVYNFGLSECNRVKNPTKSQYRGEHDDNTEVMFAISWLSQLCHSVNP